MGKNNEGVEARMRVVFSSEKLSLCPDNAVLLNRVENLGSVSGANYFGPQGRLKGCYLSSSKVLWRADSSVNSLADLIRSQPALNPGVRKDAIQ